MANITDTHLPLTILDILPNPVLVKASDLSYVWVNKAFEDLFGVKREDLIGQFDLDVFPNRQAAQCNGGDLRVLASGEIDEATETVFKDGVVPRITITRKSRLTLGENQFLVGIMHDITDVTEANQALKESKKQLEEQSAKLTEMAYTDSLTGVMNRRRLNALAQIVFGTHRNQGCALLFDLDYFKRINDQWGHDAGDSALIHFVNVVNAGIREGDLIARMGGDEFACLMPGTDRETGAAIAERIRDTLEHTPLQIGENKIYMTVSIGMSISRESSQFNLENLLSKADKYLYQAKESRRNQVVVDHNN